MAGTGLLFKDKIMPVALRLVRGLLSAPDVPVEPVTPPISASVQVTTGSTGLPDLTIGTSLATTTLLADVDVPLGMKLYITRLRVYASTAASGGTSGTVSLTIQDSAGTTIATFTEASLTSGAYIGLPAASPPSGVTDSKLKTLGASTATNKGVRAVLANSTAGVFRIDFEGYFAP